MTIARRVWSCGAHGQGRCPNSSRCSAGAGGFARPCGGIASGGNWPAADENQLHQARGSGRDIEAGGTLRGPDAAPDQPRDDRSSPGSRKASCDQTEITLGRPALRQTGHSDSAILSPSQGGRFTIAPRYHAVRRGMGSQDHGDIAPSVERGVRKITVSAEQTVADGAVISRRPTSRRSLISR